MNTVADMLAAMTPEQRQSLAAKLLAELTPSTTPIATSGPETKESYYNMDEAVPVTFKASLAVNEKSRDKSYAERFDHVWCKGHYRVKGPKGGVYFVGRCVMGVKKGQQVKGTLRVGNKYFEPFLTGGSLDAWFRPDGQDEAILIGTLSNFKTA